MFKNLIMTQVLRSLFHILLNTSESFGSACSHSSQAGAYTHPTNTHTLTASPSVSAETHSLPINVQTLTAMGHPLSNRTSSVHPAMLDMASDEAMQEPVSSQNTTRSMFSGNKIHVSVLESASDVSVTSSSMCVNVPEDFTYTGTDIQSIDLTSSSTTQVTTDRPQAGDGMHHACTQHISYTCMFLQVSVRLSLKFL